MTGLHCSFGENIFAVLALAFNYLSQSNPKSLKCANITWTHSKTKRQAVIGPLGLSAQFLSLLSNSRTDMLLTIISTLTPTGKVVPHKVSEWLDYNTPGSVSSNLQNQKMATETFDEYSFSSQTIILHTHTYTHFRISASQRARMYQFYLFSCTTKHPIRLLHPFIILRFDRLIDPLQ